MNGFLNIFNTLWRKRPFVFEKFFQDGKFYHHWYYGSKNDNKLPSL